MPLDLSPHQRAADLNARYRHHGAVAVLEHALKDPLSGELALVSSFGAESVVLLHLISIMEPSLPVVFLDTEMLFPETIKYQEDLAGRLGLTDVRRLTPDRADVLARDPDGVLHQSDPDACCALRKTRPLAKALAPFDGWITGRKRFQGGTRAALDFFEPDPDGNRIKINPLAHWDRGDVQDYIVNNRLPRHPLVAQGFPSIGCAPCTSRVAAGEDPRAGRWRGSAKTECGIHFGANGVIRRSEEDPA
jgi:phosphoadenosine phosphosulfate reductase